MRDVLTVRDALAVITRSSLPAVVTEGSSDYRVMRKVEERLSDLGVDFLPVGGRQKVLEVWMNIPSPKRITTVALVDLDLWLYFGIPPEYQGAGLFYTKGYSIENDLFIDGSLLELCDAQERKTFLDDLKVVAACHAREIVKASVGSEFQLAQHVNAILSVGDISGSLTEEEYAMMMTLLGFHAQALREKILLELLARQLNRQGRYVKIGYKQIYEFGSSRLGCTFLDLEHEIRRYFTNQRS